MRFNIAKVECLVVFLILSAIAVVGGSKFTDWSASAAVFLGFVYSQRSFDLADLLEVNSIKSKVSVNLEMQRIFIMKELVWMTTFYAIGSYPLLCGAFVFAVYPSARKLVRQSRILRPEVCDQHSASTTAC